MSSELPKVSIIIFAYAGISYLPATLDSVLEQTDSDFEILVFSDDYRQIHSWFRRQPDTRLRFIVQSNLGLANILNQGVIRAQGQYISFLRAGDLWHPHKLEQQLLCFDREPEIGLIHSHCMLIDHQSQEINGIVSSPTQNTTLSNSLADLLQPPEILAQNQISLSSVVVRRSCFERVGLFDPQLEIIPDWDMWIRLSNHYRFMQIADPLVCCRQLPEDSTKNNLENWLTLETDLQTIIETAYAELSPEQERQKNRSYSYASLLLAHHALQSPNLDLPIARNYWYQALVHNPLIVFSLEFCQLRWKIFRLHCQQCYQQSCQQSDRPDHLKQLMQDLGNGVKTNIRQTREDGRSICP